MEPTSETQKSINWVILYNAVGIGLIIVIGVALLLVLQDTDDLSQAESELPIEHLTPSDTHRELLSDDIILVDVRSTREWEDGEHAQGAISIPINQFDERVFDLLPNKNAPIVVMCYSRNTRSLRAVDWLRENGYTNVRNLDGGLSAWVDDELPTEPFVTIDIASPQG